MSDSDDEHPYAKYGNALKDLEEATSKPTSIPIHEQTVTDEQGRRRFHGAFTGGFSAGYYNSVGSKDGWTPSQFKSTRAEKNEKKTYSARDFMDTEDISDFGIAPTVLQARQNFQLGQKRSMINERQLQNEEKKMTLALGTDLLESLIVPARSNIGKQLLGKLGWKEGQGIGPRVERSRYKEEDSEKVKPKVYGCYIPGRPIKHETEETYGLEQISFAPKDQMPVKLIAKADLHGLGYSGINPTNALFTKHKKSSGIEARMKSGNKLSIQGQAFGVGAYEEEDDDIYSTDVMDNYDKVLTVEANPQDTYGWTKPKAITHGQRVEAIENKKHKAITGFIPAEKNKFVERKVYRAPVIPKDFDCNRRLNARYAINKINEKTLSQTNSSNFYLQPNETTKSQLNANDRKKILGDNQNKKKYVSVFDYISPEDRNRMEKAKKKPDELGFVAGISEEPKKLSKPERSNTPLVNPKSLRPFNGNPEKQRRYEQYERAVRQRKQDPYSGIDSDLTEWERNHERHEFSQLTQVYSHLTDSMNSKFTKASEHENELGNSFKKESSKNVFGIMTRDKIEWHPDPLLCKRFNVPDPYPKSDLIGIAKDIPNFDMSTLLHADGSQTKATAEDEQKTSQSPINSQYNLKNPMQNNTLLKTANPKVSQVIKETEKDNKNAMEDERASLELFKSIFAASSDEESDSESDEELQEEPKTPQEHNPPPSMPHVFTPKYKTTVQIHETVPLSSRNESIHMEIPVTSEVEEVFGPALPPPRSLRTQKPESDGDCSVSKRKEKHKKKKSHKKSSKHKKHKKQFNRDS